MVLRGSYGVRIKYDGMNECMIKVQSGSFGVGYDNYSLFYMIAKVMRGLYWVRIKYNGKNASISQVHTGSYGVGYTNH